MAWRIRVTRRDFDTNNVTVLQSIETAMSTNISPLMNLKFSPGLVFVFKEKTIKEEFEDKIISLFPKFSSLTTISELPFIVVSIRVFV